MRTCDLSAGVAKLELAAKALHQSSRDIERVVGRPDLPRLPRNVRGVRGTETQEPARSRGADWPGPSPPPSTSAATDDHG